MRNASLPNIFLASKSFSQSYLADFSLPCIVPHKAMQSFLYPISHTLSLTRAYAYTRVITVMFFAVTSVIHQDIFGGKSYPISIIKEHKAGRTIKRKTRRGGERKVENTPLPKSKNREEIRTKKRKAVKGFLVVCVVRNRLLRQQVNKV